MTELENRYGHLRTYDTGVEDELVKLETSFKGFHDMFYLLDKIGEGTFSCVYKAIDLQRDGHDRSWEEAVTRPPLSLNENPDRFENLSDSAMGSSSIAGSSHRSDTLVSPSEPKEPFSDLASDKPEGSDLPIVAVKRIHVTSSPTRIANELKILATLSRSPYVSHVITAMRDQDQVVVVMEYLAHTDFRNFYSTCSTVTIRGYMAELLSGLAFVHSHNVIHRDIKPTNFLYDVRTGRGVLVDFGLAEFEQPDGTCPCLEGGWENTSYATALQQAGHRKDDPRPSKRANRAGTRGFRAPEVLLKCNAQTTKIDIWSAGVVLLMFLGRRFPFFNSIDDAEALVEIATIFGRVKMKKVALLHGSIFETTLPTIRENGHSLSQLISWCNHHRRGEESKETDPQAIDLLSKLMDLDFRTRVSAEDALRHPFFTQESNKPAKQ